MKTNRFLMVLSLVAMLSVSCEKPAPSGSGTDPNEQQAQEEREKKAERQRTVKYVGSFINTYFSQVYVWADYITNELKKFRSDLSGNTDNIDLIKYVDDIVYKDDRWTFLTDDVNSLNNSLDGVSTTYGFSVKFYYYDSSKNTLCAVVQYVYHDSPAEQAGLKRGDAIVKVNGMDITLSNYNSFYTNYFSGKGTNKFTVLNLSSGKTETVTMTGIEMYEDPVLLSKVFDVAGKKVGYLFYTSFTLESITKLKEAIRYFQNNGVTEVILDFRYNGGGYMITETALATMLAPEDAIGDENTPGDILDRSVFNSRYMSILDEEDRITRFQQRYPKDNTEDYYNVVGYNLHPTKIYAIMTSGTASASEIILMGLGPYVDYEIFGEPKYDDDGNETEYCSHGKYCTASLYDAEEYVEINEAYFGESYKYALKAVENWGLYLIISRVTDKDGNCPVMPNGFKYDYKTEDNPLDGYQIGDEDETMLKAVLDHIAGKSTKSVSAESNQLMLVKNQPVKPTFGMFIDPSPLKLKIQAE